MNEIIFFSADKSIPVIKRRKLKACISKVFSIEGYELKKISYIFCSDQHLLELNKQYLKHDYYTDILTFLLSNKKQPVESEIYISRDRVKENAKTFEISYQNELLRVMIHGALHLCGYKDDSKKAKEQMHYRENFYIQLYSDSRET